ncbi:hypothetical protein I4U23_025670 [Adineta vaga]|nr:hypothetical protein I4U23_025670 [Adineta vaga]
MLMNRFSQLILSKNIIRRQKWTYSKVSSCGTYHICLSSQQPLYENRFKIVLPFHSPGLAPVIDRTGAAFHINDRGEDAYPQRFSRTFGFYENLAAVQNIDYWYHIKTTGTSAYSFIWQWCGNFQSYRCPVRDFNLQYYHIDPKGKMISGPHSYAGDFREGSAVVRSSIDGLFHAIDENGDALHSSSSSYKISFLDLDVYHKGLARARDENGWFFIDRHGMDAGQGRRYRQIENFYNGQALVQMLHDGSRCIIDEQHNILARLNDCNNENCADIEQMSKNYWPAFALKIGLEQKTSLLDNGNKSDKDDQQLKEQIQRVWNQFGFIKPSSVDGEYTITQRGRLLFDSDSIIRDRALYWLQDEYISGWLPSLKYRNHQLHANKDLFSKIAKNPELMRLTQRVLNSYANQDWHGIASVLPDELFQSSTIVDLGGGMGALLCELSNHCSNQHLICIDRPEVINLAKSHPKIEFQSGDLFSGSLPTADFYLLSRVLHDWPDEKAKLILNHIPSKHLCVIEREVDLNGNHHALLSLHMFFLHKAKERTRQEWDNLFSSTGWSVQSRTPFSDHVVTMLKKDIIDTNVLKSSFKSSKTVVRKVVVPTAGLGTRMRPQSTIIPKILLPIAQSSSTQWTCRPVLDLLLEEIFAEGTGIEEVLLVIAPEQLHLFQSYFSSHPHNKIDYILQTSPKGFGHAVLQTEQYISNEPFVVMLSDHLYQPNNTHQSCLQQLLTAYRQHVSEPSRQGLTGVMTCTAEEFSSTGLLQSDIDLENRQFFQITDMIEKPSINIAMNRFQFKLSQNSFLCQAGMDILPPTIFHYLRLHEQKLEQETIPVELGLREAMNGLRQNGQLFGCLLDGERYDIGDPKEYYRTFRAFTVDKREKSHNNSSISNVWSLLKQIDKVQTLFSISNAPIHSASAPGRLDLMGGFADYSGSHVLQYPIAQRTYAFIQPANTSTIRLISIQTDNVEIKSINQHNLTIWDREIPMSILFDNQNETLRKRLETWYTQEQRTTIPHEEPVNWPSYIVGILAELIKKTESSILPVGFNIVVISDVPCNKGVASSAALEVAVARAACSCLNLDNLISKTELALLCQFVENYVVGSSCGFMDQMTCVHACTDHLFSLLCQHVPNPSFHNVTIPSNIQLFGIDSGVKRSTAGSTYRRVRTATFMGKQLLNLPDNIHHLCQITLSKFNNQYRMLLPEKLVGKEFQSSLHLDPLSKIDSNEIYPLRAATAHPIEENFRVQLFEQLLKNDHYLCTDYLSNLGELMFQADASYRACDLASDEINLLVNLIRQQSLSSSSASPKVLLGAKITGGGGGGTVAILARKSSDALEAVHNVVRQYENMTKRQTRIFSGSSSGLIIYPSITINA